MRKRLIAVVPALLVAAAVSGIGYLIFFQFGFTRTLEATEIMERSWAAPESQCNRARDIKGPDVAIMCVADPVWIARYFEECAKGDDTNLLFVTLEGAPQEVGKCPPEERRKARELGKRPIPPDLRIADAFSQASR